MIDGRAARYFETEQAVREALQDHDRDDDADETLMVV